MRAFLALARTALRQQMQYRSAALAGVATQLAFGFLLASVYQAFYAGGSGQGDLTLAQTVGYVWLSQGTYRMMPWSGLRDIDAMMRDGRIAFELARPRDLFSMWYGRAMSLRTAPLLINLPLTAALQLMGEESVVPLTPLQLYGQLAAISALVFAVFAVYLVAAFFVSWQDIRRNIRGDGRL